MIAGAPIEATLGGLSDVVLTDVQSEDILFYDPNEGAWVNSQFQAGTVLSVDISGDNAIEVANSPITMEELLTYHCLIQVLSRAPTVLRMLSLTVKAELRPSVMVALAQPSQLAGCSE